MSGVKWYEKSRLVIRPTASLKSVTFALPLGDKQVFPLFAPF